MFMPYFFAAVTYTEFLAVLVPLEFLTVKLTVNFPALVKVCVALWACLELVLSPKSQYQDVGVPPVLVSVNSIVDGAAPDVAFAVKAATGGFKNVTVI